MMREEDLIRIAKKLDKMVSRNNTDGALDLLKELRSFNMTLKLLQETRIGMSVNGIRKHCTDEEVVTLAKLLIKDWKRLLDAQSPTEMKNGVETNKHPESPVHSPSDRDTSHRRPEVEPRSDSEPDVKDPDRPGGDEREDAQKKAKQAGGERKRARPPTRHQNDGTLETSRTGNPPQEPRKEKQAEENKHRDPDDAGKERRTEAPRKERHIQDHHNNRETKTARPSEEHKKDRCPEEPRKERGSEDERRESHAEPCKKERRSHDTPKERPADNHKWVFERRSVLDGNLLYPSRYPSPPRTPRPPRPLPPVKRPSVEVTRERKDSTDSLPSPRPPRPAHRPKSTSPPPRRPSLEVKKERKKAPDPNAPFSPLPLHLHPPPKPSCPLEARKERKGPPDPNAPFAPLPLHLHPPPPPKRLPVDGKKERKETSDARPVPQKRPCDPVKHDRKNSSESKAPKLSSAEAKKDRKDSSESKPQAPKRSIVDGKKDRKDSTDSKSGHPVKRHSLDSKPDRKESTDSKKAASPPAKKLSVDRRESHGSKSSPSATLQRKASTDSIERRVKPDTPRSPTTPTSPMSPSFSSPGGPLSPRLATGDSVRDKCIELLAAALRTDDNYKEFGTNCDAMAAEMEDHIYQENRATDMKYKNRVRSRISNLKDPKNPGLRRNVLAGGIELSRFAVMSAEEMASDELKQLRNVQTQEAIREHQLAKTGGTSTDLLQCDKCRKKNCTYNQVQTRSADEPMTTFVLCNECGHRWKFC